MERPGKTGALLFAHRLICTAEMSGLCFFAQSFELQRTISPLAALSAADFGETLMRNAIKLGVAALLTIGTATVASAQVYGVPGVDYGYPPYVSQPPHHNYSVAPSRSERVYENGKLIGQDPDPNVRMMLRKDFIFE